MRIQWSLGRRSYRLALAFPGLQSPKLLTLGFQISEPTLPPRRYGLIVWRQRQLEAATNKVGAHHAAP